MPPSDRPDPAEGAPSSVDTDQVFIRLQLLYRWLLPSVKGQGVARSTIANAANAPASFRRIWHDLLPDERERAVDRLVSRFADLEAGVHDGWDMVRLRPSRIALLLRQQAC